jgi:predicted transcriptional regulator
MIMAESSLSYKKIVTEIDELLSSGPIENKSRLDYNTLKQIDEGNSIIEALSLRGKEMESITTPKPQNINNRNKFEGKR